jgi:dihydrofolate synthase/folylpolyglutamate synthase
VLLAAVTEQGARICLADRDFCWHGSHEDLSLQIDAEHVGSLSCSLAGRHQLDNFALAVAAAIQLRQRGWSIPENAIRKAGRTITWPGRLEWWGGQGKVLTDVAHNRAGISSLADYLEERRIPRVHLVVGLSGERAPEDVLKPLASLATAVYAVPLCYGPAVATARIATWATAAGLPCTTFDSAVAGLTAALQAVPQGVPVVVCGSLYLVAELRQKFLEGTFPLLAVGA